MTIHPFILSVLVSFAVLSGAIAGLLAMGGFR